MTRRLVFVLTLLCAACAPGGRTAERSPAIAFAQTEHSFGRVEPGGTVVHEFAFTNSGGIDLTIDKVRVGCDCSVEASADRFVPPGGSGRIRVRCDPRAAFGPQRLTATVYSNDPKQPFVVLALVGEVDAVAAVEPSPLYVGRAHQGQRAIRGATVRSADAGAIDVVAAADAPFTIDRTLANATDETRFDIVIKRDAPIGRIDQRLRVQRRTGELVLEVPVIGEITAPDTTRTGGTTR